MTHKMRVHLIAYSFAGVDARCAISLQGLSGQVQSLTTLCTPHHGLTLIDRARTYPQLFGDLSHTEKALEVLGMSIRNAGEFTSENMRSFNQVAEDDKNVAYYSFGAKQKELQIGELLRANY